MSKGVTTIGEISKKIWDDLTIWSNKKIQFRDTGLYLQSDSDGSLTIASDGAIKTSGMNQDTVNTFTADTDVDGNKYSFIELDGSSASVNLTNLNAYKGQKLVITCSDSSNATTVTTVSGTTLDGTNDKATFDAAGETLVLYAISATQFVVVENIGSVTLGSS